MICDLFYPTSSMDPLGPKNPYGFWELQNLHFEVNQTPQGIDS